jgi:xanthine dehydrogenase YagR molybdenum-binding subunit
MQTRINGREVTFEAGARTMALEVVRETAGLTGAKLVCGAGVCGACTIELDGTPIASCLLPAHALDGRSVRTIEGVSPLHPVQKAFMAADGLQCGFCTPGFVVDAIALYEAWKASGKGGGPSRDAIASALSGHLCRCGAYLGIFEAVERACAGEFDGDDPACGPRVEAREKVTGSAIYTVDVQSGDRLEGIVVRSPHAHARVAAVDLEPALAVAGVVSAVRLLDVHDPVVRWVGQPVAAVAATTRHVAEEAARAVDVRYEPMPFVVDLDVALRGEADAYEGEPDHPPNSSEGPVPPASWDGNTRRSRGIGLLSWRPRRAEKLIELAHTDPELELVSGTFETADQIHTALEPHAAVARWPEPDALEVHVSTQSVDLVTTELAKRFSVPRDRVRVRAEHVGGGFGAKQGLQVETIAAVELSRAANGAPVRVVWDRHEEMAYGGYRPGARVEIDLVADRGGALRAVRIDALGSGGVAVNSTIALLARLFYPGVPKSLLDRDVVTNLPPGKPFRGPFGPPFFLAMESSVDDMAHRLGIDAIELRERWDPDPRRAVLYAWARGLDAWKERGVVGGERGRFRRGIGVAMGGWINLFYAGTVVEVAIDGNGVVATTTTQDMGNGSRSVIAQAVAETLWVDRAAVRVEIGESTELRGPTSSGSRTTNAVFMAATKAAEKASDQLARTATRALGLRDVRRTDGGIAHAAGRLSWTELASRVGPVTARGKRGANHPLDLLGRLPSGKLAVNFARPNTGAVYVCEVLVDTRLGRIEAKRFWAGIAAGRIVAPVLARRQIEGAIIQGVGYALYEERNVDPRTGTILNLGLEEFRIPGIGDAPEVEIHFHEGGFEKLAGHAAGLSELATVPVAAALSNAVFHATGRRFRRLPLRPGRVLEGLA